MGRAEGGRSSRSTGTDKSEKDSVLGSKKRKPAEASAADTTDSKGAKRQAIVFALGARPGGQLAGTADREAALDAQLPEPRAEPEPAPAAARSHRDKKSSKDKDKEPHKEKDREKSRSKDKEKEPSKERHKERRWDKEKVREREVVEQTDRDAQDVHAAFLPPQAEFLPPEVAAAAGSDRGRKRGREAGGVEWAAADARSGGAGGDDRPADFDRYDPHADNVRYDTDALERYNPEPMPEDGSGLGEGGQHVAPVEQGWGDEGGNGERRTHEVDRGRRSRDDDERGGRERSSRRNDDGAKERDDGRVSRKEHASREAGRGHDEAAAPSPTRSRLSDRAVPLPPSPSPSSQQDRDPHQPHDKAQVPASMPSPRQRAYHSDAETGPGGRGPPGRGGNQWVGGPGGPMGPPMGGPPMGVGGRGNMGAPGIGPGMGRGRGGGFEGNMLSMRREFGGRGGPGMFGGRGDLRPGFMRGMNDLPFPQGIPSGHAPPNAGNGDERFGGGGSGGGGRMSPPPPPVSRPPGSLQGPMGVSSSNPVSSSMGPPGMMGPSGMMGPGGGGGGVYRPNMPGALAPPLAGMSGMRGPPPAPPPGTAFRPSGPGGPGLGPGGFRPSLRRVEMPKRAAHLQHHSAQLIRRQLELLPLSAGLLGAEAYADIEQSYDKLATDMPTSTPPPTKPGTAPAISKGLLASSKRAMSLAAAAKQQSLYLAAALSGVEPPPALPAAQAAAALAEQAPLQVPGLLACSSYFEQLIGQPWVRSSQVGGVFALPAGLLQLGL